MVATVAGERPGGFRIPVQSVLFDRRELRAVERGSEF